MPACRQVRGLGIARILDIKRVSALEVKCLSRADGSRSLAASYRQTALQDEYYLLSAFSRGEPLRRFSGPYFSVEHVYCAGIQIMAAQQVCAFRVCLRELGEPVYLHAMDSIVSLKCSRKSSPCIGRIIIHFFFLSRRTSTSEPGISSRARRNSSGRTTPSLPFSIFMIFSFMGNLCFQS